MADATTNTATANSAIVAFYPEIASIATLLDNLATVGRKRFVMTLEDIDHASAILEHLIDTVGATGYKVARKGETIIVSF